VIREARPVDVPQLARLACALSRAQVRVAPALEIRVPTAGAMTRHFSRCLKDRRHTRVFVAEADAALIGFIHGTVEKPKHFTMARLGILQACYVASRSRREGVGRALVDAMVGWFSERGIRIVDLGVLASNPAQRFWRKLGFREFYIKMRARIRR